MQLLSPRRNEPDPFPTQPVQNYNVLGCGYDPDVELPAMRVWHASFFLVSRRLGVGASICSWLVCQPLGFEAARGLRVSIH